MIADSAPIGLLDSGVGGLSVLREVNAELPDESTAYVADSAHAPWGDKPPAYVRERGLKIARFLAGQGAKVLVIASNTGTAGSADAIRAGLGLPVVAMEPGIKPAAAATRSGVIAAMVTAGMGGSARMASLLDRFGRDVQVITVPVPGIVEHVEAGDTGSPELRAKLAAYLGPALAAGADTLVLGSTHYVFLRETIAEVVGESVQLVDTGAAVARQLRRVLSAAGLLSAAGTRRERFWTSGDPARVQPVISALLARPVTVERLPEQPADAPPTRG